MENGPLVVSANVPDSGGPEALAGGLGRMDLNHQPRGPEPECRKA